nr:hypothetical protein TgIa.0660c [Toxoplasma gondii RH]
MQKRQPAGDIYRSQRQELQPRVAAGLGSTVSGRTEEGACCGGGRAWDGGQGMNQDRLKSVDACTTKTPFGSPSPSAPVAVVFQTPLSGQLTPTAPTATLGIASALVPGGLRSSTPQILSGPTSPSVLPVLSVAAPGHPPARAGAQPVLVVTTAQASTGPQPPQMLVVTHPSGGQPPSSYTVPTYVVSQGGNGFGAGCDGSPVGCFPPVSCAFLWMFYSGTSRGVWACLPRHWDLNGVHFPGLPRQVPLELQVRPRLQVLLEFHILLERQVPKFQVLLELRVL